MMKENRTTCLNYANHHRCNTEHKWGNLYEHLTTRRIFTFDNKFRIFIQAPRLVRIVATNTFGFANHLTPIVCFHILQEVGANK